MTAADTSGNGDEGTGSPSAPHPLRASYTPGPWLIGQGADGYPIIHTAPDSFSPSGQGIAHICKRAMCQDHTANARLIATGPEMHAALKEAERFLDYFANERTSFAGGGTPKSALATVRAALSKAGV